MPDINAWIGTAAADSLEQFPLHYLMSQRGVSVTLKRGAVDVTAQTVVMAASSNTMQVQGGAGISGVARCTLHGWRGVTGKTDFDVARGDKFVIGTVQYKVTNVRDEVPGRRIAECEGVQ